MERWLNSRELGAKIVRPAGVVICTFTLVLNLAAWMDEAPPLGEMIGAIFFIGAVQVLSWRLPAYATRKLAPRRAQLLAWRAELEEGR